MGKKSQKEEAYGIRIRAFLRECPDSFLERQSKRTVTSVLLHGKRSYGTFEVDVA